MCELERLVPHELAHVSVSLSHLLPLLIVHLGVVLLGHPCEATRVASLPQGAVCLEQAHRLRVVSGGDQAR